MSDIQFTENELANEVWKDIPGHLGYQVSDLGRVRNAKTRKVMRPSPDSYGYAQLNLRGKSVGVHRCVLLAFHGDKPTPRHECRHLDGIKTNNRQGNLIWGTHLENMADKHRHGTQPCGEQTPSAILSDADVVECRRQYAVGGIGNRELAERYGVDDSTMQAAISGRTFRHLHGAVAIPAGKLRRGDSRGERNSAASITNDQAVEVVRLRAEGMSHSAIARKLGHSRKVIGGILRGSTFQYLPGASERMAAVKKFGNAKLTDADAREIRRIWDEGKVTYAELGRRFGITDVSAANVVKRKTFGHI